MTYLVESFAAARCSAFLGPLLALPFQDEQPADEKDAPVGAVVEAVSALDSSRAEVWCSVVFQGCGGHWWGLTTVTQHQQSGPT